MKRISLPWSTIFAFTTAGSKKFMPCTPWLDASQVKRLRAIWELIAIQNNMSVEFAIQVANVENAPDTAVAVGGAATADGVTFGTLTDVSATTNGKQLVRFGFLTQNTSAATLICVRAGGTVEYLDS